MHLAELLPGDSAVILSFTDLEMSLKFLEMGCIPGELVRLERTAPLGDPIAISVAGYLLSMRKAEAATILVEKVNRN
ncbi:MAG: ferrous iron transport protein A [Bacteroidetes bacterium]|nr:ferrous iron transport protein A [Bacteroidota bacterium]